MSRSYEINGETIKNKDRGFALIEVMFALGILCIGLLCIATIQITAIEGSTLSSSSTKAYYLAEKHMETIIDADYNVTGLSDLNSNGGDLNSVTMFDHMNTDAAGNEVDLGKYDLIINIAEDTPIMNTKTIVVMIAWDDNRRVRRLTCIKSLTG
jgi:prepilin-type N-terminal cleavage/methylation domain-containing protein